MYTGKCTRYYPAPGVAEFVVETGSLQNGDTVLVMGNRIGVVKHKQVAS